METLLAILGNAHFEAYIGGPIAGFVFGLLFSAFGSRPPPGGGSATPSQVRISVVNQNVVNHNGNSNNRPGSNDDSSALFIALMVLGAIAALFFAAYLPQISTGLSFFITFVAMFSITVLICAWVSRQLDTWVWSQHVVLPFLTSVAAFAVILEANSAISQDIVVYARSLLGGGALTFAVILNGAFVFAKQIGSSYMQWMTFIMLAFTCAAIGTLFAFFQCMHYLALANIRYRASSGWVGLAVWTKRFCGWGSSVTGVLFIAVGWLCATGRLYAFFQ